MICAQARTACCEYSSSADVASSSRMILGRRRKMRAMATRWRWPPDRRPPRSPTRVWYASFMSEMKSCACASAAAASTSLPRSSSASASSLSAPGWPYAIFLRMLRANSGVSCATMPKSPRYAFTFNELTSRPSNLSVPPRQS